MQGHNPTFFTQGRDRMATTLHFAHAKSRVTTLWSQPLILLAQNVGLQPLILAMRSVARSKISDHVL